MRRCKVGPEKRVAAYCPQKGLPNRKVMRAETESKMKGKTKKKSKNKKKTKKKTKNKKTRQKHFEHGINHCGAMKPSNFI